MASPPTLDNLRPRLVRFLPPALQTRLRLQADPIPAPDLDALAEAVSALHSLAHTLSTYVPRYLAEQLEPPGVARGTFLEGTILFADISGFTWLAERLGQQGPAGAEELTTIVNRYFGEMLDILAWSGGDLLKFAGDALLVYFPALARGHETEADWAVRAAWRMQRAMAAFRAVETSQGRFTLGMKVGLASGRFLAAQVGVAGRMELIVTGPAIQEALAAEGQAQAGQVLVSRSVQSRASVMTHFRPGPAGFRVVEPAFADLGDFEIATLSRRRRVVWPAREAAALLHQIAGELDRLEALAPYLDPELVSQLVTGGKRRHIESAYRATTVLFGNFVGPERDFTAWQDREDGAQLLTSILDLYFTRVHRIITERGGIISRIDPYSQGSKLLVLFGAPVAHEDDAERALDAALAIRTELAAIEAAARSTLARFTIPAGRAAPGRGQVHPIPETPADEPIFRHRTGITLGHIFAGEAGTRNRREYTVMGDEVNLAARLMAAAEYGQILLSQRVQECAGSRFLLQALAPIRVKGKSQPIPIYEARGYRRIRPASWHQARLGPLCDRHEEMAVVQDILDDVAVGRGQILILAGEAGIGKTRLAAEIGTMAEGRGFLVLWGAARGYGESPSYDLWRELLAALLQVTTPADLEDRLEDADTRLALADVLGFSPAAPAPTPVAGDGLFRRAVERAAPAPPGDSTVNLWALAGERLREHQPAGLDTLEDRVSARRAQRVRQGVTTVLERYAARQPLLLILENAQWMAPASWELLTDLAPQLSNWPILTLVLVRPGTPPVDEHVRALERGDLAQVLHLGNLDLTATADLARTLLGVAGLPDPVAELVYARSQGQPLFVIELVQALRAQGYLSLVSGHLRVQPTLDRAALPTTVSGLILSRIDQLAPAEQHILKTAAVIGRRFRHDVLQCLLTPIMSWSDFQDGLTTLARRQFIVVADEEQMVYAFSHGLTQETLYDSLPQAERRSLHRAIGECLETLLTTSADLAAHREELAMHFGRGGCPDKATAYLARPE